MKAKNLPLLIGIALPIVFIAIVSLVLFAPSWSVDPKHDFIYSVNDSYYQTYQYTYNTSGGRIVKELVSVREGNTYKDGAPTLYLYDVQDNTSKQITFEEAQQYSVVPGPSSPDGYTVAYEYGHSGIFELFGTDNSNSGYFIEKENGKKKLTGLEPNDYYRYGSQGVKVVAWIK